MSADNWAICPRCKKNNDEANSKRITDAEAEYGKIPSGKYRKLIAEAEAPLNLKETFREDYEMWVDEDGLFYVAYSGVCGVCSLEKKFHHEEDILTPKQGTE